MNALRRGEVFPDDLLAALLRQVPAGDSPAPRRLRFLQLHQEQRDRLREGAWLEDAAAWVLAAPWFAALALRGACRP